MKDGLYKVQFQTPHDHGAGVVVLSGGKLLGGDFSI
jgi:cystathionine beta-lyase/cystathionine gamma-synthase